MSVSIFAKRNGLGSVRERRRLETDARGAGTKTETATSSPLERRVERLKEAALSIDFTLKLTVERAGREAPRRSIWLSREASPDGLPNGP